MALLLSFFFFNDTATTEIYTLSLHDALPICQPGMPSPGKSESKGTAPGSCSRDRKSTRLNSSHSQISYAVFCLKKKKNNSRIISLRRHNHGTSHTDHHTTITTTISPLQTIHH